MAFATVSRTSLEKLLKGLASSQGCPVAVVHIYFVILNFYVAKFWDSGVLENKDPEDPFKDC